MDQVVLLSALLTTVGTIFVTELTDKDALFLLALATERKPLVVFGAGSIAFTITTAIIVTVGSVLLELVPVKAVELGGGAVMLAYAVWEAHRLSSDGRKVSERSEKLPSRCGEGAWSVFLPALLMLIALDLAGDATEVVTVVLLARFEDVLLVFSGAVVALVAAVAVEVVLGNGLGKVLSRRRIRYLSILVFVVIGITVITTTLISI